MPLIEPLVWDSQIFGFGVCRFSPKRATAGEFTRLMEYCRRHHIRMAYSFLPSDGKFIDLAERFGFHHICSRIVYEKNMARGAAGQERRDIRIAFNPADETLGDDFFREISYTIGETSRFFRDERFPKNLFRKLYTSWVQNCFSGRCDANLVAFVGKRPAGWVGLIKKGREAVIDLVGVLPKFQGSGVGSALADSAERWAKQNGVTKMSVVTEGETIGAQRYYQKHGFLVSEYRLVYHVWPTLSQRRR